MVKILRIFQSYKWIEGILRKKIEDLEVEKSNIENERIELRNTLENTRTENLDEKEKLVKEIEELRKLLDETKENSKNILDSRIIEFEALLDNEKVIISNIFKIIYF